MLGKITLDLSPKQDNPRNSEGAFIKLNDGRIMFVYSRFRGQSASDDAATQIAARFSSDGGKSWNDEDKVFFETTDFKNAKNIMSVSLMRMDDGAVGLFFLIRYGWLDLKLNLFRSYDEGESWSEPVCCVPPVGYYVTNNDRVIRTQSGRILVPGNLHRFTGTDISKQAEGWLVDGRASGYFYYSDDDGKTWKESKDYCQLPFSKTTTGLQETGIVELDKNLLWAWFRTDLGVQYQSYSHDDGVSWSSPIPSQFTSPASPMQIKRLKDERLIAIWNPIPNYNGRVTSSAGWGRTPFALAISSDNAKSWSKIKYLEDDSDDEGFCYPAIFEVDDGILVAYCAGGSQDKVCLAKLRIRHISFDELN